MQASAGTGVSLNQCTYGFVALLVFALLGISAVNYVANG
jgi:hypothetical protein